MKIYAVTDPLFHSYGQVVTGLEDACAQITQALREVPLPQGVGYVPTEPLLQKLPAMEVVRDHCFGTMPVQLGWCCGHNRRLNCLEYHRDSEFNLGTDDFILLLARQDEIEDGVLDTAKVRAFHVPAGTLVEVFATTLHYAPCHTDAEKGFRVMVALPAGTNTNMPGGFAPANHEDGLLWARNKWLLAHPESDEAGIGAYVGLKGVNIDLDI